jgi:hypothetical protein
MRILAPCLLAASIAAAAPCAYARTVKTGGTDDQRVTEGVSGPAEATPKAADRKDQPAAMAPKKKSPDTTTKKPQHPPPPPLHDPN